MFYLLSAYIITIFVKLRSQLSEKVPFQWVVFKLSFFMYIFNCLMVAVTKAETCSEQ